MSFESVRSISLVPTTDAIAQHRFVEMSGASIQQVGTSANDSVGVALEASAAASFDAIAIALLDGAKVEVEAGAAITAGVRIMSDASGRAITATGATARVLGVALQAATAAGEVITVLGQKAAGEFVA